MKEENFFEPMTGEVVRFNLIVAKRTFKHIRGENKIQLLIFQFSCQGVRTNHLCIRIQFVPRFQEEEVLDLITQMEIGHTPMLGAARYLTLPMESTNSLVPGSIGVGLMTNKSPLVNLMILVRPPTFAPPKTNGVAMHQMAPGTTSLEMDSLGIVEVTKNNWRVVET